MDRAQARTLGNGPPNLVRSRLRPLDSAPPTRRYVPVCAPAGASGEVEKEFGMNPQLVDLTKRAALASVTYAAMAGAAFIVLTLLSKIPFLGLAFLCLNFFL